MAPGTAHVRPLAATHAADGSCHGCKASPTHVLAFWDFMNSSVLMYDGDARVNTPLFINPHYATGFPIIVPYWAIVNVGGAPKAVLPQCFERRGLTYTPTNLAQ